MYILYIYIIIYLDMEVSWNGVTPVIHSGIFHENHPLRSAAGQVCVWLVGCQCRAGNFKGWKIPSNARGASRDLRERRNRISGIENLTTNGDRKLGCLAGSGTKPEQPAHPPRETVPTPNANQNQSVAEQMVLNLQEQQLLLQKQLLALQEKQQAVEVAAATTAATSTEDKPRQKVPAQPSDEDLDTPGSNPPRPKVPKTKHAAKPKPKSKLTAKSKATKGKKPKAEWLAAALAPCEAGLRVLLWQLCRLTVLLGMCWGLLFVNLQLAEASRQAWGALQGAKLATQALVEAADKFAHVSREAAHFEPAHFASIGGFTHLAMNVANFMLESRHLPSLLNHPFPWFAPLCFVVSEGQKMEIHFTAVRGSKVQRTVSQFPLRRD